MIKNKSTNLEIKILRLFKKIHRITGVFLFFILIIIAITGILLGLKNNSANIILMETKTGISSIPKDWLELEDLIIISNNHLKNTISPKISLELDRIDIRPEKGIAKLIYKNHYWSIQIDCTNGEVISLEKRYSDIIENIHDGSIIDKFFNIESEIFKLIYTSIIGLSLLIFSITGFWIWYGPKRIKNKKAN